MPFVDLNNDLILTCFQLLCDDVKSLVALSSVSKGLHQLSLSRHVWCEAYDAHRLSTAFGPKSRHPTYLLKQYAIRYSKASANLESSSPKVISWKFFPVDNYSIKNAISTLLFARFMFQVTSETVLGKFPSVVRCYDMDDSLRLLWERGGDWLSWGKAVIRSCDIVHGEDNGEGSVISILLQAAGRNQLDLRTFRIKQNDQSIQLCEVGSQVLDIQDPSGRTSFSHQGKWILRDAPPPYLTNMDKPKNYFNLPPESGLKSCSFAGRIHVIARTKLPSVQETKFGLFKLPEINHHDSHVDEISEPLVDERNPNLKLMMQVIALEHLPQSRSRFKPLSQTPDMSFLCWGAHHSIGDGFMQLSIMNILTSPPDPSQPIQITEIDDRIRYSAQPSLYRGWIFRFTQPTPNSRYTSLYLSRLLPRLGGGLCAGIVKEVILPDGVEQDTTGTGVFSRHCVFDEFAGRLYFATNKGLYVVDFA